MEFDDVETESASRLSPTASSDMLDVQHPDRIQRGRDGITSIRISHDFPSYTGMDSSYTESNDSRSMRSLYASRDGAVIQDIAVGNRELIVTQASNTLSQKLSPTKDEVEVAKLMQEIDRFPSMLPVPAKRKRSFDLEDYTYRRPSDSKHAVFTSPSINIAASTPRDSALELPRGAKLEINRSHARKLPKRHSLHDDLKIDGTSKLSLNDDADAVKPDSFQKTQYLYHGRWYELDEAQIRPDWAEDERLVEKETPSRRSTGSWRNRALQY